MKVSVLIPTKNEPLINELIDEIHKVLKKIKHEVIVIDKSDVKPKIRRAKLIIQKSNGLGAAVLEGLFHASGDVIVTMDGDFSHRPKDLPKLLEKIREYDIVIGSRFIKGGKTLDRTHRKIISEFYRKFASLILGIKIKDNMSGFSVIRRQVYEKLKLSPIGFKINLEIIYKARKFGFKIIEVPIIFQKRKAGKTKAGVFEALRTLIYILKIRFV